MSPPQVHRIESRDNPSLKAWRALAKDNSAYRQQGQVWLEGDHLCRAALARGWPVAQAVFAQSMWARCAADPAFALQRVTVLPDPLFDGISPLAADQKMGFVLDLPATPPIDPNLATVVLDQVQDAGNVGSILRSAAAFGFAQVVALRGTAGLWSPKVVRAGMGAHFALRLCESASVADALALRVPLIATSSHRGDWLHQCEGALDLPWPCAWLLGHEGQGVQSALLDAAQRCVRIAQPGGEESLNVAAAAAVCLHASAAAQMRQAGR
jgi:TrmH family RNA methyltransferase